MIWEISEETWANTHISTFSRPKTAIFPTKSTKNRNSQDFLGSIESRSGSGVLPENLNIVQYCVSRQKWPHNPASFTRQYLSIMTTIATLQLISFPVANMASQRGRNSCFCKSSWQFHSPQRFFYSQSGQQGIPNSSVFATLKVSLCGENLPRMNALVLIYT
jgi:hypothetical protein